MPSWDDIDRFLKSAKRDGVIPTAVFDDLQSYLLSRQQAASGNTSGASGPQDSTIFTNFIWFFGSAVILTGLVLLLGSIAEDIGNAPTTLLGLALSALVWVAAERIVFHQGHRFLASILVLVACLGLVCSLFPVLFEADLEEKPVGYILAFALLATCSLGLRRTRFLFFTVPITVALWGLAALVIFDHLDERDWILFFFYIAWATLVLGWVLAVFTHLQVLFWTRKLALLLLGAVLASDILDLPELTRNGLDPVLGWTTVLWSSALLAVFSFYCRQNDGYVASFLGLFAYLVHAMMPYFEEAPTITALLMIVIAIVIILAGTWLHKHGEKIASLLPAGLQALRPKTFKEPVSYIL